MERFLLRIALLVWVVLAWQLPVLAQQTSPGKSDIFSKIRFAPPADESWRRIASDTVLLLLKTSGNSARTLPGASLLKTLPGGYLLIRASKRWQPTAQVTGIATVDGRLKQTPALEQRIAADSAQTYQVIIEAAPGQTSLIAAVVESQGGRITSNRLVHLNLLEAQISIGALRKISALQEVLSVGVQGAPVPLDLAANAASQAMNLSLPGALYHLRGQGMTAGVGDNSAGILHVDLRDRVLNFFPYALTGLHGIQVSGVLAGNGTMWDNFIGVAPEARVLNHIFDNVWLQTADMRASYGMTVTNNSYANIVADCSNAGAYDGYAQALDQTALAFDDVLHVFATGNDGTLGCSPFPAGYGTVPGGYQAAKNVLCVGNIQKNLSLNPTSSRGPVQDGRLKPEIAAVGTAVAAPIINDNYLLTTGTSIAAPSVAGTALLLAQRYKALHGGQLPKSDLLKALLMNGATDLGVPGPDFEYGYGKMDALRSLTMLDSSWYTSNTVTQGTQQSFVIQVPPGLAQLRIMLYYHDQPGSALSSVQLVQDLDLSVKLPDNTIRLPLRPDPAPGAVSSPATEGEDHLNNAEQVVIHQPTPGAYTVMVSGYSVPAGAQGYVVVYDMPASGITLTWPTSGTTALTGDSMLVYWQAEDAPGNFTLEWRDNPSAPWLQISNTIPDTAREYTWTIPTVNSEQCQMRLSRNGSPETFVSGPFVLNDSAVVTIPLTDQCPGAIHLTWSAVPNATGYEILQKTGSQLQVIDTTTLLQYTRQGLSPDSFYYMSVRPLINGVRGQRTPTLRRKPSVGNCSLPAYNYDLALEKVLSPRSGRLLTNTALTANETLVVRVRNQDNLDCQNYTVSYSVNASPWVATPFTGASNKIVKNATRLVSVPGLNLAAQGSYTIRVAITNNAGQDPVAANDTFEIVVRQIPNPAVDLTLSDNLEDFEGLPVIQQYRDSLGIFDERWDFFSSRDTGRLRTFIAPGITIAGSRSASLDNLFWTGAPSHNVLQATYNLGNYSAAAQEVRLVLDYRLSRPPAIQDSNKIYLRGSDGQPLLPIFNFPLNAEPGMVYHTGPISLSAALLATGQDFSTSTQLQISQFDTGTIASAVLGQGLTVDNIRISLVSKDVAPASLVSPLGSSCSPGTLPVTVYIRNLTGQPATNVPVAYAVDGGPPQSGSVPSIAPYDSVLYTFPVQINSPADGGHQLKIWTNYGSDDYVLNDTVRLEFHVLPLISTFPYLQNFETSDGYFFAEGENPSWSWQHPTSFTIPDAASGNKAWKTNHLAQFQDYEASFLYTPCFDISTLSQPMLSFSQYLDLEPCSPNGCEDYAFVQYSTDGGATWQQLGSATTGFHWYNSPLDVWVGQPATGWRVASVPLPAAGNIRFRFAYATSPGTFRDGLGVDDFHIYDLQAPIYSGAGAGPVTAIPSGNTPTLFTASGAVLAAINPQNQSLGSVSVTTYEHSNLAAPGGTQYILPRSFVVAATNTPADSVLARFYILDREVDSLKAATGCATCDKPKDAYRLGITQYDNANPALENNSLSDNTGGTWIFYPDSVVRWVPYDSGYYAEIQVPGFSEFWISKGSLGPSTTLPLLQISMYAQPHSPTEASVSWRTTGDELVQTYVVEASRDGKNWLQVESIQAHRKPGAFYQILHTPDLGLSKRWLYRVAARSTDETIKYTAPQWVAWGEAPEYILFPNPVQRGTLTVQRPPVDAEHPLDISIFNASGQQVLRTVWPKGVNTRTVDVSKLPPGIYTIILSWKKAVYLRQTITIAEGE